MSRPVSPNTDPMQRWAHLLNEAIERRIVNPARPLSDEALRNMVLFALRDHKVTADLYGRWRGGKALPSHDVHEALLGILARYESSSPEQLQALRDARLATYKAHAPQPRQPTLRPARSAGNGATGSTIRRDKYPVLATLRENRTEPYENLTPTQRDKIFSRTQHAGEYLICYLLNQYEGVNDAANKTGITSKLIGKFISGDNLPEINSLEDLKRLNFFHTAGHYDHFRSLVIANRRLVMAEVLENRDYYRFGNFLSDLPPDVAASELKTFLTTDNSEKSRIISHGIYLHFLRQASGLTISDVHRNTGISIGSLRGLESDSGAYAANIEFSRGDRPQLQAHLEAELARGAREFAELFADLNVRARIMSLPTSRPRAAQAAKGGAER